MKKSLIILLILFLVSSVGAYNFGTFTYQTSKQTVDRNVSFEIGAINPGDQNLNIRMSTEGLENGRAVFPENNFELEPTEVSKNPKGENWVSVEPGRYFEVEKMEFWVIMDEKVDEEFKVRIEAEKTGSDSSGIKPRTVQVRDYGYSIEYPEEEAVRVSEGYDRGEEGSEDGLEIIRPDQETEDTDTVENEALVGVNGSENFSKTSKTSEDPSSKEEEAGGVTTILALGALGSVLYLWMVI